jgi:Ala-tRNA(Pro) deacylase
MTSYHPVVNKIRELLDNAGIPYKTFEHEPVRTSEEAAALRPDYSLHQGAKALVVKVKRSHRQGAERPQRESEFVMLVVPGDCRFNESKVKQAVGAREIRFATEAEVSELTGGVQVGGVPPFGNLFNLPAYADPQVLANEDIIFNAGDRAFSIAMRSADWQKIVKPNATEIV